MRAEFVGWPVRLNGELEFSFSLDALNVTG